MKNHKISHGRRGFVPLVVIAILAIIGSGVTYYVVQKQNDSTPTPASSSSQPATSTEEKKLTTESSEGNLPISSGKSSTESTADKDTATTNSVNSTASKSVVSSGAPADTISYVHTKSINENITLPPVSGTPVVLNTLQEALSSGLQFECRLITNTSPKSLSVYRINKNGYRMDYFTATAFEPPKFKFRDSFILTNDGMFYYWKYGDQRMNRALTKTEASLRGLYDEDAYNRVNIKSMECYKTTVSDTVVIPPNDLKDELFTMLYIRKKEGEKLLEKIPEFICETLGESQETKFYFANGLFKQHDYWKKSGQQTYQIVRRDQGQKWDWTVWGDGNVMATVQSHTWSAPGASGQCRAMDIPDEVFQPDSKYTYRKVN